MRAQTADPAAIRAQLEALHAESFAWGLVCCADNPAEAEDVLQMSYFKILDHRVRFEGRSSFKTWLFGVIRFTAREQRRRWWWRWTRHASLEEAGERATTDTTPDEAIERRESIARVREACARLAERQREVLMLVFDHELSLDEAAVVMRVSSGTARKHYQRGKEQLRAWLGAEFSKR
jgi:RNA polymerase sigma-70 factor (ECF subfamily)